MPSYSSPHSSLTSSRYPYNKTMQELIDDLKESTWDYVPKHPRVVGTSLLNLDSPAVEVYTTAIYMHYVT